MKILVLGAGVVGTASAWYLCQAGAALLRELGCPRNTVSADEVIRLEPALRHARRRIVGGDFTASDESGDVHLCTTALAARAAAAGVDFCFGTTVTRLLADGECITGVECIDAQGRYRQLFRNTGHGTLG